MIAEKYLLSQTDNNLFGTVLCNLAVEQFWIIVLINQQIYGEDGDRMRPDEP